MLVGVPEDQFLRSIQLDSFSCGSHSVFMVLRFFGITLRHGRVKRLLGTKPETGTAIDPMVRLLRNRGLRERLTGWALLLSRPSAARKTMISRRRS